MNINFTEQQEAFIRDQVESGRYANAAEVVREAMRLFEDELVWKSELRRKVAEGIDAIKAGRILDGPEAMQELKARIRSQAD